MKKVLIIAYYFPPSGGPGVQRVLKHVQYLTDFGWQPIVLTVSNGDFPARDESLMKKIPAGTIVERTHIYEPYDLYRALTGKKAGTPIDVNVLKKEGQKSGFKDRVAEFIRATLFIPDARVGWLLTAVKRGEELIKEHGIDAIYSSSPPYTCSLIGRALKRRTGLPWVAGLRDPWTEFLTTPKRWFLPAAIDRALEKSVFKEADAVECAWEGIITDALRKYPDLHAKKFHHVPNGFDSSDFPKLEAFKNEKFTITYTGSLYGRRNPASFFKALEMLIDRGVFKSDEFHLRFVGRFGAEIEEMFDKASFKNSIEIIKYVPHEESIRQLFKSDALLLIVDEAKESEEIVPGKVYEYIGVKRPVIAVAPQNSAIAKLLKETGSGKVAEQSEIEKCAAIIEDYFKAWKSGKEFSPDEASIVKYERRESARVLANLLNKGVY
ncbi:MAG TPA: glycosyltransferase [Patescibacteria group bacterium]|nr:glycosyltransferase [Patescibacteria group bacterium]